ncbi:hypothetical protein HY486_03270 [Candidatus Woesearchaeota archaeon]|nr:hypothetical protein [Candidatus Woesearchaeota archaeon]
MKWVVLAVLLLIPAVYAQVCAEVFIPVCSEGKTYSSECHAKADGVTSFTQGACTRTLDDIKKEAETLKTQIEQKKCAQKNPPNECNELVEKSKKNKKEFLIKSVEKSIEIHQKTIERIQNSILNDVETATYITNIQEEIENLQELKQQISALPIDAKKEEIKKLSDQLTQSVGKVNVKALASSLLKVNLKLQQIRTSMLERTEKIQSTLDILPEFKAQFQNELNAIRANTNRLMALENAIKSSALAGNANSNKNARTSFDEAKNLLPPTKEKLKTLIQKINIKIKEQNDKVRQEQEEP